MIRRLAFWAPIAAYVVLAIIEIAGAAAYPGYSHTRQFISELGAHGAPNGALVSIAGFGTIGLLLMLFAVLGATLPPPSLLRYVGFAGLFAFGASYLAAAVFRCDFGCSPAVPSAAQQIHSLFGLIGYLAGPAGLILLGFAARKWPGGRWLFPLGIICGLVAAAAFQSLTGDMRGLAQRVLEAAVAVFILACAVSFRRKA